MAWLPGWANRLQITVTNNIDVDLTNFILTLKISASSGVSYINITKIFDDLSPDSAGSFPNRKKIAVTSEDGVTQLFVEIDYWDHLSQEAFLRVRVPYINSGSDSSLTILFLYWDWTQPDNTPYVDDPGEPAAIEVWQGVYSHAWGFGKDPNLFTELDSAGNRDSSLPQAIDLTAPVSSGVGSWVDGLVGKAIEFEGNQNSRLVGSDPQLGNQLFALQCWVKMPIAPPGVATHIFAIEGDAIQFQLTFASSNHNISCWVFGDNSFNDVSSNLDAYNDNQWHFVVLARTSVDNWEIWIDIADHAISPVGDIGALTGAGITLEIGAHSRLPGQEFTGTIDDVRLSVGFLSDAWIKASYYDGLDKILTYESPTPVDDLDISALGKMYDDLDVYALGKIINNLDILGLGKLTDDLDISGLGKTINDLDTYGLGKIYDDLKTTSLGKITDDLDISALGKMYNDLDIVTLGKVANDLNILGRGYSKVWNVLKIVARGAATVNNDLDALALGKTFNDLYAYGLGKTYDEISILAYGKTTYKRRLSLYDPLNLRLSSIYAAPRDIVPLPLVYGDFSRSKIPCTPLDQDGKIQHISDGAIHSIIGVYVDGEPKLFGFQAKTKHQDETGKPIACIVFDLPQYDAKISVACRGRIKTDGELIEYPVDFIEDLFLRVQKYDEDVLDIARSSFKSLCSKNDIKIAPYLKEVIEIRKVLDELSKNIHARWLLSDGKQRMGFRWPQ